MTARIPVAILGATGTVGQKFVTLLAAHPWFEIVHLAASAERVGKRYGDEVRWREATALPESVATMTLTRAEPAGPARIAFSALDAPVAREVEPTFARAGVIVVTNASAFRMDDDIPLIIPEVNAAHLGLLDRQRANRKWSGAIVANPNCSTAAIVTALAPLHRSFGLHTAMLATLQAASGAGYPGVPSLDILGNVIPYIGGEEEKIEHEIAKILGQFANGAITHASINVSAMVHRVPVVDGHMVSGSLGFDRAPSPDDAIATLEAFTPPADVVSLPMTPARTIEYDRRPDRPQSRLDLDRGNGMTVTVGRVRPCPINHIRLVALAHNVVRGAAGAAVQNAELLVARGLVAP